VLAGYIRWTDYRGRDAPSAIRITHYKTGAVVLHPLEDADGAHFYADAEALLCTAARRPNRHARCSRQDRGRQRETSGALSASGMAKLAQRLRQVACARSPRSGSTTRTGW